MIRLLPFILIPVLIVAGAGFWRYQSTKQSLTTPKTEQTAAQKGLMEVPKSLPAASLDDRVKSLEDSVNKLIVQLNLLKTSPQPTSSSTSALDDVQSATTELKARVSALEKTPAVVTSSKSTVYIPLGAGGSWGAQDWYTLSEYEVSLDPSSFPGYTSMNLEVNFRLTEAAGTASIRLYNVTDNSAMSGQVDTTSTNYSLQTTSSFNLPAGKKTYRLQVKSSQSTNMYVQFARIRVNF